MPLGQAYSKLFFQHNFTLPASSHYLIFHLRGTSEWLSMCRNRVKTKMYFCTQVTTTSKPRYAGLMDLKAAPSTKSLFSDAKKPSSTVLLLF